MYRIWIETQTGARATVLVVDVADVCDMAAAYWTNALGASMFSLDRETCSDARARLASAIHSMLLLPPDLDRGGQQGVVLGRRSLALPSSRLGRCS